MHKIHGFYLTEDLNRFSRIQHVLPGDGFDLTHVASLDTLETQARGSAPDFLLCDLPLPGLPALQVLDELQVRFHQPLIAIGKAAARSMQDLAEKRGAGFVENHARSLAQLPGMITSAVEQSRARLSLPAGVQSEPTSLILEHLSDCVLMLDLGLRPMYINTNASRMLGFTLQELYHIPLAEQLPPPGLQLLTTALASALSPESLVKASQAGDLPPVEVLLNRKEAAPIWAEARLTIVRDAHGGAASILIIFHDISTRKEAEKLQQAVFEIAQLTFSTRNLVELYPSIHQVLGTLMRADNFYIAFYDPGSRMIEFPYFVDEFDPPPPPHPFGHGLTEYVIRTGQPVLASPQLFENLYAANEVESIGTVSFDWLGVPLNVHGKTIGMMAVQTYSEGKRYTQHDLDILTFVSNQVAMVLERKRSEEASNRYAAIVNNAGEIMSLIDRNYRYAAVNDAYCQRIRRSRDEILGQSATDIWGSNSFENAIKLSLDRCFAGETVNNEAWFDFRGQYYGYYKVSYYPYRDQNEAITHAIVITHEITDHKLSELALQHRLEMEQITAQVTSRLIYAPGGSLETDIQQALQRMGEFINADRSFLNWFTEDMSAVENRMEWCAPGISPRNPRYLKQNLRDLPNLFKKLQVGEPLHYSPYKSDDPDVENLRKEGIHSLLLLPLSDGGALFGTLGFESIDSERNWIPEDIEMLKVIAQALAGSLRRRRSEQALARRNSILEAINYAASQFLSPTPLDEAIQNAIHRFAEATQVSRVYLYKSLPSKDGKTCASSIYEWAAEETFSRIHQAEGKDFCFEEAGCPRWCDMLCQGELVYGGRSSFPAEEKRYLETQGVHSILIVPIFINQRWWGFIGFDECRQTERHWLVEEREALRTAAVLVGNGLLRQQTEDELRESELKFRNVISQSVDGITLTDQDGILIEWNRGQEIITGMPREEVLGLPLWEIMYRLASPEKQNPAVLMMARQSVLDTLRNPQEDWSGMTTTHQIQRKDGSRRLMFSTSFLIRTPQGVMLGGSNRDITNEKEAESRIRDSEQRFRAVFENAGLGIALLDLQEHFIQTNPSFQKMLGYSQAELQALTLKEITHPEDYAAEERRLRQIHNRTYGSYTSEKRYFRKDGSILWGLLNATVIYDEQGNPMYGMGMVQDISERKQAEVLIRETQQQLATRVQELEANARQIALLTELSNMLQLSSNPEEVFSGITRYGNQIFPEIDGAVFILDENKRGLRLQTTWGKPSVSDAPLLREDCWAIRRVRPYLVDDGQHGLVCRHIGAPHPASSLCLPVTIQSQVVGLLNLQSRISGSPLSSAQQQFAAALAEQLGLTLSNIELRKSMSRLMIQDPLTGLYNRLYMEEALEREIKRCEKTLTVVKFDLDNLTQINSRYGFLRGDNLLRELARLLKLLIRPIDIACRTGGDEFILIFPEAGLEHAISRINEFRQSLAAIQLADQELTTLSVTISSGVAVWPQHGNTTAELILAAEKSQNRAKLNGGDCIEVA